MGVKGIVQKIANGAGNKVAKLAALSSDQVSSILNKKEEYLLEQPKPGDDTALELTWRMMAASSVEIFNSYLPQISDLYLPIQKDIEYVFEKDGELIADKFRTSNNIRYFNITQWVVDKKENNLEKLVNVYSVLSNENCNIALVFNRTQTGTNVYLAVCNVENDNSNTHANIYLNRLIEAVKGNFPGSVIKPIKENDSSLPFFDDRNYSVATASNIPAEKSEKFISQTIEKLLDGIVPDSKEKEYTIVLLATPILDVEERKSKLSEFYSGFKPYVEWETSYQLTETESKGSSATVGINVGASAGIQNGNNYSEMKGDAVQESQSSSQSDSMSSSVSEGDSLSTSNTNTNTTGNNTSTTETKGSSNSVGVGLSGGRTIKRLKNIHFNIGANYNHGWFKSTAKTIGESVSESISTGITNTVSKTLSQTVGTSIANTLGKAVTKSMAVTTGLSKAVSFGANAGANFARSSTVTAMIGKNEGITQHFMNYGVKHATELLENQMKRYEQSSALGMWDFAAYVLCEDPDIANNVAHTYLALTLGEESYMSKSAVNVWNAKTKDEKYTDENGNELIVSERDTAKEIVSYIKELRHPIFALNEEVLKKDRSFSVYPSIITATTALSGKELAYSLNFPQKSVVGFPVIECVPFGRNINTFEYASDLQKGMLVEDSKKNQTALKIGNVFHMNRIESSPISLNAKSLASHTFVTGSTGSGKSNTVYKILSEAKNNNVKFLVVEPAKGEYKDVFGGCDDVYVYGTNPKKAKMLKINPFGFSEDTHVLEHLDRLVEIFNVCWPMYAAMPAVLKNAIEKSYTDCGWDLLKSENKYGEDIYPTFSDVARNIRTIIDTSEYDAENKGAYKGSLLTRLQSLTNGINGTIFVTDEIPSEDFFDKNVIIDLSRVGSSETKSLIMGILVLKLQEYRMENKTGSDTGLKHLTVLEEAHNLLKRTSASNSNESGNLLGKSVEMLANAIAEMRTYGEGFVIVDQAPGLLDMSVIRNTNTKIIMRLPDQGDRELVGKAANLNDDQITEIAKIPCGVAAIYQNEWLQPVLCKIEEYKKDNWKPVNLNPNDFLTDNTSDISNSILDCLMNDELNGNNDRDRLIELKSAIIKSKISSNIKVDIVEYLNAEKENAFVALRTLIYDFLSAEEAIKEAKECTNIDLWTRTVLNKLNPSIKSYSEKQIDYAIALILYEQSVRDAQYNEILVKFVDLLEEKGEIK